MVMGMCERILCCSFWESKLIESPVGGDVLAILLPKKARISIVSLQTFY